MEGAIIPSFPLPFLSFPPTHSFLSFIPCPLHHTPYKPPPGQPAIQQDCGQCPCPPTCGGVELSPAWPRPLEKAPATKCLKTTCRPSWPATSWWCACSFCVPAVASWAEGAAANAPPAGAYPMGPLLPCTSITLSLPPHAWPPLPPLPPPPPLGGARPISTQTQRPKKQHPNTTTRHPA